ncbi:MAG: fumarylacetoacetate hydrolase family protein [Alphaproteobacteria bacterium]|nr:fumarylacetoacetate hydrolase family protein [Alphaproteobacteria bacterium]
MKIVTFVHACGPRLGFLDGGMVVDPAAWLARGRNGQELAGAFSDAASFIRSGQTGLSAARSVLDWSRGTGDGRVPVTESRLIAPVRPATILCSGSNYHDHNAEKAPSDASGKEPEFFVKTSDCIVGPNEPIILNRELTKKLDAEVELAVVIGRPGRNIPVDRALEHVFGYTIVNDVTARDQQVRKRPDGTVWYALGVGKVFDTSAPTGPCIVTAEEIPDPQALTIKSRVNGELRQGSTTANMIWNVAQLIHFFSISMTLQPGMLIITGTPSGTAWSCDAELGGRWKGHSIDGEEMVPARGYLQPGDRVTCEIEKIGILENVVAAAGPSNSSSQIGPSTKEHAPW